MTDRYFINNFKDFSDEQLINSSNNTLNTDYKEALQRNIELLLVRLYQGLENEEDDDPSVYTGISGIALLHLHMYQKQVDKTDKKQLQRAKTYLKRPLHRLKGRKLSFICGDAGPLAIGAVVYHYLGNEKKSEDCIKKLLSFHNQVADLGSNIPDEILYGRSGYLYSLIFIQKHLGKEKVQSSIILKVWKAIIESGESLARAEKWKHPLMYQWHEKYYLGAAHGIAGILYMLMQIEDEAQKSYLESHVRPTVDFMMTLRFPSGNGPSSIGSSNGDKLVHWCHGAPGWIFMFIQAYKTFSDDKYLDAAKECGNVIWSRGLLRKGYGLCHGTAGNAYGFLALYKATQDQSYLYKAYKFAEWCFNYGRHECRRADTPFSLFEGLAGTVYFLTDLLDPLHSAFPGFEINV